MKTIAIINTQSPFNTPAGRDSLDLALIFGAFEQPVTVIFLGDGVYQLLDGQNPEAIDTKDYLSTMKAFELYDIEHIVCGLDDMKNRGISVNKLSMPVEALPNAQIGELLNTFDHVITM
ncbi:MAG: sulfurtransferase complex subunit TusC [Algicola sp.]|nr:sulfurtransferase complex subunit TusC [Algicola sp.]